MPRGGHLDSAARHQRGAVIDGDVNDMGPVGHADIPGEPGPRDAGESLDVNLQRPGGLNDEGLADLCMDDAR